MASRYRMPLGSRATISAASAFHPISSSNSALMDTPNRGSEEDPGGSNWPPTCRRFNNGPKFVKLVIKQAFKIASPLVGSFMSDVGAEIRGRHRRSGRQGGRRHRCPAAKRVLERDEPNLLRGLSDNEIGLARRMQAEQAPLSADRDAAPDDSRVRWWRRKRRAGHGHYRGCHQRRAFAALGVAKPAVIAVRRSGSRPPIRH
jgi:hypothetical protein